MYVHRVACKDRYRDTVNVSDLSEVILLFRKKYAPVLVKLSCICCSLGDTL